MLDELAGRLKRTKITLKVTDEVKQYLAETGYDKTFGARPLRRTILQKVEDPWPMLCCEAISAKEIRWKRKWLTVPLNSIKIDFLIF